MMNEKLIEERIRQKINNIDYINVLNFSREHMGHNHNSIEGSSHFHITLVSDFFLNTSRVKRHKTIMSLFSQELSENVIHALSLSLCTTEEFEKLKDSTT